MSSPKKATHSQHYVSRFYLKQWTDDQGLFYPIQIDSYDPPVFRILDRKSKTDSFCCENYFYAQFTGKKDAISQLIEETFSKMEGLIAPKVLAIENKILTNQQITAEDKFVLSEFMIFLHFRGKKYRMHSAEMSRWFYKNILKSRVSCASGMLEMKGMTREGLMDFIESDRWNIDVGNVAHLRILSEAEGFCNLLSHKYWKILVDRKSRFIATDTPYHDMPTDTSFWGNDFLSREQCFTLSPRVFILIKNPTNRGNKKILRKDVSGDGNLINSLNDWSLRHSVRFGFHEDGDVLERLQNSRGETGERRTL